MAKWGEGDPRWIVEERPDAVNVNNWHWTEKDAKAWSKDKLKELLVNLNLDNSAGTCKITEIDRCDGDATANNRKAKIIVFYEWEITLKWKGKTTDGDQSVSGNIIVPNLSDENTMEDLDIQITSEKSTSQDEKMKTALREECTEKIRDAFQKYIEALKKEYTQNMILPKKEDVVAKDATKMSNLTSGMKNACNVTHGNQPSKVVSGVKLILKDIDSSTSMMCTARDVFNVLLKPEMFKAFTNGSGKIDPKVGGTFEMFGGNVSGRILTIEEDKKLVQLWRFKHWPEGHYSHVTFTFEQTSDSTNVKINQKGVPEDDVETTREGWERYYWGPIKRTFAFGVSFS